MQKGVLDEGAVIVVILVVVVVVVIAAERSDHADSIFEIEEDCDGNRDWTRRHQHMPP